MDHRVAAVPALRSRQGDRVMNAREALAEAARAETARVYGKTMREVEFEARMPAITVDEYDDVVDTRRAAVADRVVVPIRRRRAS